MSPFWSGFIGVLACVGGGFVLGYQWGSTVTAERMREQWRASQKPSDAERSS